MLARTWEAIITGRGPLAVSNNLESLTISHLLQTLKTHMKCRSIRILSEPTLIGKNKIISDFLKMHP